MSDLQVAVNPDSVSQVLRDYVRDNGDIRKDEYAVDGDPINGACYVLSEAYFHATGGVESPFDVYRIG